MPLDLGAATRMAMNLTISRLRKQLENEFLSRKTTLFIHLKTTIIIGSTYKIFKIQKITLKLVEIWRFYIKFSILYKSFDI